MWGVKEQNVVYLANIYYILEAQHFIKNNIRTAIQEILLIIN
jgi:hypothetical protein